MTLTPEIAQAMDLNADQAGALVGEVVTNSPADDAGLKASDKPFEANGEQIMIGGDVITAVDGKAVESMEDLSAAVKAQKPGDKVEIVPNHGCTTINLHDEYHVIRRGVLEAVWPIAARGKVS